MISIICWYEEPPINAIGWSTYCMSLTMTEWGIPVTGMHSGQHITTKHILHIYNWLCVVHPSYWDVLSDINYFLIWWASHQCHWMKHMLHVFNHDWMVNPSNWDALGTMNYVLMMHILNITNCVFPVHTSNWDALGAINYILRSMYVLRAMSPDKIHIAYLQPIFLLCIPVTGMH